tara:strand:+ start:216 stop:329 length:114 start_codon:yes stop_codon:yes gene_type:complete
MTYNYDHIIKILKERYGWTKVPLIEKEWWKKIKDVRF